MTEDLTGTPTLETPMGMAGLIRAVKDYLSTPNYTETNKVDIKDLLALAGVEKVSELSVNQIAPMHRLIEQLSIRPHRKDTDADLDVVAAADTFDTVDGYGPLAGILRLAYEQSALGKGKERHGNGKPFLMQPIMSIGRMVGPGYPLGQAMKKAQEAGSMFARGNTPAASAELLGVIVYTAAAIILMSEQESKL